MMNVERVAAILILLMLPATVGATEKVYTNADLKPEERVSAVSKPHVVFADVKNYDPQKLAIYHFSSKGLRADGLSPGAFTGLLECDLRSTEMEHLGQ